MTLVNVIFYWFRRTIEIVWLNGFLPYAIYFCSLYKSVVFEVRSQGQQLASPGISQKLY